MLQTQAGVRSCILRIIGEVCLSLTTGLLRAWLSTNLSRSRSREGAAGRGLCIRACQVPSASAPLAGSTGGPAPAQQALGFVHLQLQHPEQHQMPSLGPPVLLLGNTSCCPRVITPFDSTGALETPNPGFAGGWGVGSGQNNG